MHDVKGIVAMLVESADHRCSGGTRSKNEVHALNMQARHYDGEALHDVDSDEKAGEAYDVSSLLKIRMSTDGDSNIDQVL